MLFWYFFFFFTSSNHKTSPRETFIVAYLIKSGFVDIAKRAHFKDFGDLKLRLFHYHGLWFNYIWMYMSSAHYQPSSPRHSEHLQTEWSSTHIATRVKTFSMNETSWEIRFHHSPVDSRPNIVIAERVHRAKQQLNHKMNTFNYSYYFLLLIVCKETFYVVVFFFGSKRRLYIVRFSQRPPRMTFFESESLNSSNSSVGIF